MILKFFRKFFKKSKNKLITISLPELEKGRKIKTQITVINFELTNETFSVSISGGGGRRSANGSSSTGGENCRSVKSIYNTEQVNDKGI